MPTNESPLKRSIGLSGVIRWLIAVALIITVGAAAADRRYAMAGVLAAFAILAVVSGFRASRAREAAGGGESSRSPL